MISVIIPVYNVDKYLHVCLNSVLKQNYQDFEIICIDDNSTDSSLEILEYFEKKDSRIKIFKNKTKKGLDFCKNMGLKIAKGNYIYFFENIGWLDLDTFEILTNAMKNNNVELVLFKSIFYNQKSKYFQIHQDYNINFMEDYDLKVFDYQSLDKVMQFVISNVPLNKFFLKSCLDDKQVNELFSSAKKILFINRNLCNIIGADKNSTKLHSMFNNLINEIFPSIQNIDDIIEFDSSLIFNWINAIEEVLTKRKLMDYFKIVFLEFKLSNIISCFNKCSDNVKEEFYNDMRQEFFKMRLKSSDFEKIDFNLYRSYIRVLNYEFDKFKKFNNVSKGNYNYIIKKDLNNKIENFDVIGINKEKRMESIIVSLTSFPERLYDIHYCLYSLLNQTFKPDKLILCLARDEFPNGEKDIPINVLNLKKNGLSIKWCDDLKSFKKLIPVLKDYPDDFIVTVDDDIYYPEDLLETLWDTYKKHPNTIIASRTRSMKLNSKNQFESYHDWKLQEDFQAPSFLNFFTGAGGVLYFPNALSNMVFEEEVFKRLCPNGDDIWFWAMAIINNTKITGNFKPYVELKYINISRELGLNNDRTLWNLNKQGQNDVQLNRVLDYFPEILKIINEDIE